MRELVQRVLSILRRERAAFFALSRRLKAHRTAMMAGRANRLAGAVEDLAGDETARRAAAADLDAALRALAQRLGLPADADPRRLGLTEIARRLPDELRRALLAAAAATREAAEGTRLELAVGERLLQHAGEFQETLVREIAATLSEVGRPADLGLVDVTG